MASSRRYYVYILASISGTLYVGITSNLHRRVFEHRQGKIEGFTGDYGVYRLVYWKSFDDVHKAIAREKQLKGLATREKDCVIHQTESALGGPEQRLVRP